MYTVDGSVDGVQVGSERRQLIDDLAKLKQGQPVNRAENGVRETACRFQLQFLITARAQAGVDGDNDGKRQLRLAMKDRDLLRLVVFEDLEILLLERRNRGSAAVRNSGEDVHQLHVHFERSRRFLALIRRLLFLRSIWRMRNLRRLGL